MANNYQPHTAEACVPCSRQQFEQLIALLNSVPDNDDPSEHGFGIEFSSEDKNAYLFAELYGDETALPKPFLRELGRLIEAAALPFLEMGYASTCDKVRMGSHGGGYYRIMPSGQIVFPALTWP